MGTKNAGGLQNFNHQHEALKADLKAAQKNGWSALSVGAQFEKSQEWVYAVCRGEISFPSGYFGKWAECTGGISLARYTCKQLKIAYVPMPEVSDGSVAELTDVMNDNNDSVVKCVEVFGDGEITPDEIPRARQAVSALDNAIESELALKETIQASIDACLVSLNAEPSTMLEFEQKQREQKG